MNKYRFLAPKHSAIKMEQMLRFFGSKKGEKMEEKSSSSTNLGNFPNEPIVHDEQRNLSEENNFYQGIPSQISTGPAIGTMLGREHKDPTHPPPLERSEGGPGGHFLADPTGERRVHGSRRLVFEPTGSDPGAHELP